jgi:hypothetical protein
VALSVLSEGLGFFFSCVAAGDMVNASTIVLVITRRAALGFIMSSSLCGTK